MKPPTRGVLRLSYEWSSSPSVPYTNGGFSFSQIEQKAPKSVIPKNWILLDNPLAVDVFYNRDLLENIHTVDHGMYIHCNAGTWWTDQQGDLPGYGRVWYYPKAIANILSLHNLSRRYRVEFNVLCVGDTAILVVLSAGGSLRVATCCTYKLVNGVHPVICFFCDPTVSFRCFTYEPAST